MLSYIIYIIIILVPLLTSLMILITFQSRGLRERDVFYYFYIALSVLEALDMVSIVRLLYYLLNGLKPENAQNRQ